MTTREARTLARRRMYRRRRQVAGGGVLLCFCLIALAGFRVAAAGPAGQVATSASGSSVPAGAPASTVVTAPGPQVSSPSTSSESSEPSEASESSTSSTSATSSTSSTSPTESVSGRPTPIRATGVFTRAPGGTARQGSGVARTYGVEVETGIGQTAPAFAAAVDATLANPASWSGLGRWSLQRVTGDGADFVIRLASPATVDQVCATVGLDTRGYVSCRAGKYVMINLDRWLHAVPDYAGDVGRYRNYVINHEVGHQLGYGHQACPGKGLLAPVMQQQTFGLNGCLPNGWPSVGGVLVTGPATN